MSGALLSYPQILGELRRLCAERRTGTMFLVTDKSESARFELRDGQILAIQFRVTTGFNAIAEIMKINAAQVSFSQHSVDPTATRKPLPSTAEIQRTLLGYTGLVTSTGPVTPTDDEVENGDYFPRAQAILVAALTEFIGPMASIVVADHLRQAQRTGRDVHYAVETIAREIDNPAHAALFTQQVHAQLQSIPKPANRSTA